ncbi:hypothetical protein GCM10022285_05020 [Streptomyces tunisiensis]|uniref:Uncharacterized protein n=1 Tax=Streptomyces tunisiensis TaxID=948699 RepID=A0ABP7XPZ3_9ACTN
MPVPAGGERGDQEEAPAGFVDGGDLRPEDARPRRDPLAPGVGDLDANGEGTGPGGQERETEVEVPDRACERAAEQEKILRRLLLCVTE